MKILMKLLVRVTIRMSLMILLVETHFSVTQKCHVHTFMKTTSSTKYKHNTNTIIENTDSKSFTYLATSNFDQRSFSSNLIKKNLLKDLEGSF